MSDLDIFAAHALTGLLSQVDRTDSGYPCSRWIGDKADREDLVYRAYAIAEAMILQRKIIAADKPPEIDARDAIAKAKGGA